ncbi:hypothetical protein G9A89_015137 [Geosiphon pyriformis]|nr:hypothetical protein G9A89_015137 [Geosiphon pyriformis]
MENRGNNSKFPFIKKASLPNEQPPYQHPRSTQNNSGNNTKYLPYTPYSQQQQQPAGQQRIEHKNDNDNSPNRQTPQKSSANTIRALAAVNQEVMAPISHGSIMSYLGSAVRCVGRVVGVANDKVKLEMCDGGEMVVKTTHPENYRSTFVEVTGRLQRDNSLQEYTMIQFNEDFDIILYNQMMQLCTNFPNIFHESETKDLGGSL